MQKSDTSIQRYGQVVGVKDNMVERYKELHAAVWPDVLSMITHCHMCNYSIFLRKLPDGHHYLFTYFEYAGTDFEFDMARMAEDPATMRWWEECVPCLELLPDRNPGQVWSPMTEVFHLD